MHSKLMRLNDMALYDFTHEPPGFKPDHLDFRVSLSQTDVEILAQFRASAFADKNAVESIYFFTKVNSPQNEDIHLIVISSQSYLLGYAVFKLGNTPKMANRVYLSEIAVVDWFRRRGLMNALLFCVARFGLNSGKRMTFCLFAYDRVMVKIYRRYFLREMKDIEEFKREVCFIDRDNYRESIDHFSATDQNYIFMLGSVYALWRIARRKLRENKDLHRSVTIVMDRLLMISNNI